MSPSGEVARLRDAASRAAEVRACQTHPDVVALRIERMRAWFDRLMWTGIGLGLAFTMVNVQAFAAAGAGSWSLLWLAAWLLDPMVSLVLVAVLLAEQVTSRWQLATPGWARVAKWFTLSATYAMNTWGAWSEGTVAVIVLHSVPPLLVFVAVEAAPVMRERLSEAARRAAPVVATERPRVFTPPVAPVPAPVVHADVQRVAPAPVVAPAPIVNVTPPPRPVNSTPAPRRRPSSAPRKPSAAPAPRKLLADYVTDAQAAYRPGIDVTPAWVRSVTDCSRGLSPKVATELRARVEQLAGTAAPSNGG